MTRCLRHFMQHVSQQLQELASPSFKTKVVISLLDWKHIELETTTWLLQCTCTHIVGRTKEKENNIGTVVKQPTTTPVAHLVH